jgi:hypothetical protein
MKLSLCLATQQRMKTCGAAEVKFNAFSVSVLDRPVSYTLLSLYPRGRKSGYQFDSRMDGPRAGLDTTAKRKISDSAGNRITIPWSSIP